MRRTSADCGSSLLVRGGTLVSAVERWRGDVLIREGRIVALGQPGSINVARVPELDAGGLLVLPGLVDAHVHTRDPGLTHKETFTSCTRAAAKGGVTTVLAMPYDEPLTSSAERLAAKAALGERQSWVDFGLQGAALPDLPSGIAELASAGAVSVELQLVDPPSGTAAPTSWQVYELMLAARDANRVLGVYCDDQSVVSGMERQLRQQGRQDWVARLDSHPPLGEDLAVRATCTLALSTGAPTHLRQISTAAAVEHVEAAKRAGADLTAEATPHHVALTARDAAEIGASAVVLPPLRGDVDVNAVAAAIDSGLLDILATDHAPHAATEKREPPDDVWGVPGGFPGLETLVGAVLRTFGDRGVELLAKRCSAEPATRFGLAQRKGSLRPGHDGDLTIIDNTRSKTVNPEHFETLARYTPFAGARLPGRVVHTVVRGQVVVRDSELVRGPYGRWVAHQTPSKQIVK